MAGVTGKYFMDGKEIQSNSASLDRETKRRLWEISAQMAGLRPEIEAAD